MIRCSLMTTDIGKLTRVELREVWPAPGFEDTSLS
jgi:hypothetical protein